MARTTRRGAPPRTISRPALLVEGWDGEFRGLIHDLIAYGHRLDACRDAFAAIVGISGVQYDILMVGSRAAALWVGEAAARLPRSARSSPSRRTGSPPPASWRRIPILPTGAGYC